jgi:hypothetical protein
MEPIVPWLLLAIAALVVVCAALYSQVKQVESVTRGRQSLIADELREAEEALLSAIERVHHLDRDLAERERRLEAAPAPPEASIRSGEPRAQEAPCLDRSVPPGRSPQAPCPPLASDGGRLFTDSPSLRNPRSTVPDRSVRASGQADWRLRARELAEEGHSSRQIARDLGVPVGKVELALSLDR